MKAILCGYYGKGNGGDEALLASLLQMLPPNVEPIVLSGNRAKTTASYQVASIDRMDPSLILTALSQSQVLIWGGGSLMQDATSLVSPFYYGGLMLLAQKMGLKTIAWAQGIGPLKRQVAQILAKNNFTNCTGVSVRDRGSAAILSQWNIPFTLAPDPVWSLDSLPVPELNNLPRPIVAVNLRAYPDLTPQKLDLFTRALVAFQKITKTFILLLPFQTIYDLPLAEHLHNFLPDCSQIMFLENPRQLKGIFANVEMAIGMRLHYLIMAASAQCRCFALSYDPKVSQLMADLAMPGYLLSELPDDANLITNSWLESYSNSHGLSRDNIDDLKTRSRLHQELLYNVINNG